MHLELVRCLIANRVSGVSEGLPFVLYISQYNDDTPVAVGGPQPMFTRAHAGGLFDQDRADMTEKIVAEIATQAFVSSIVQENKKSQQKQFTN